MRLVRYCGVMAVCAHDTCAALRLVSLLCYLRTWYKSLVLIVHICMTRVEALVPLLRKHVCPFVHYTNIYRSALFTPAFNNTQYTIQTLKGNQASPVTRGLAGH